MARNQLGLNRTETAATMLVTGIDVPSGLRSVPSNPTTLPNQTQGQRQTTLVSHLPSIHRRRSQRVHSGRRFTLEAFAGSFGLSSSPSRRAFSSISIDRVFSAEARDGVQLLVAACGWLMCSQI